MSSGSVPSSTDDTHWITIYIIIGIIVIVFLPIALTYLYRDRQKKKAILQSQARDIELSRPLRRPSPLSSAPAPAGSSEVSITRPVESIGREKVTFLVKFTHQENFAGTVP
ncbi:hypothetical protein B0T19DRAFT_400343 [Cercophora scortea]|uniref:Uncharacterized protein n=1 Tax=Cercophora scortea TaxID=314031 RepID=A0AAE0MCJ6_9PEZI|nr:hypothetical protein B0T19DRAFT_400343 [Cercophora scortea]